ERPLNFPAPLRRPPIMVGGGGEKKTLRMVAKYADACNMFPTPDLAHKLGVLREHCERGGRDYTEITKTCLFPAGPARSTAELVDALSPLADLGIQAVIVNTSNLWQPGRVEQLGELVSAAAGI